MHIMAQTLAADDAICPCSEMLLQVDGVVRILDKHDHTVLVHEQRDAVTAAETRAKFVSSFKMRRKEVGQAALKKTEKVRKWGSIPQSDAKKWTPPGASIWKDNTRGGWCGHMPPRRRIGSHEGIETASMEKVIRKLWSQFVEIHGLEISDVPVQGLFQ